jgi:hypothetical protein
MADNYETRIVQLEEGHKYHEREIRALKETGKTMQLALNEIRDILKQVKWVVVGALAMLVAESSGIAKPFLALF